MLRKHFRGNPLLYLKDPRMGSSHIRSLSDIVRIADVKVPVRKSNTPSLIPSGYAHRWNNINSPEIVEHLRWFVVVVYESRCRSVMINPACAPR